MRCSNCGFENDAGVAECLSCGAALSVAVAEAGVKPPRPVVARPRDSGPVAPTEVVPDVAVTAVAPPGVEEPGVPDPTIEEQAPALTDSFTVGEPHDTTRTQWLLALIALFLGIAIGALATYLLIPATEYVTVDTAATPSASPTGPQPAGILVLPIPRGRGGPIIPPGPDAAAMQSLRNGLIGQNHYYLAKGNFTDNTEDLAVVAPEVAWEAGFAASRPGTVAVGLCGPAEPSTAVLLQALGGSGKTYSVLNQPTGPGAGIYYASGPSAFQCPNAVPPPSPWQRTLDGWGLQQPTASASPVPTTRDDRNDPVPPPYVPPTAAPTPTGSRTPTAYPTYPGASTPGQSPYPGTTGG